jgi:hypothetical protein
MLPPDGTQNDEASEQLAGRSGQRVPRSSDGFHGNGPTSMWPGNVIRKHIMDDALGVQRHIS